MSKSSTAQATGKAPQAKPATKAGVPKASAKPAVQQKSQVAQGKPSGAGKPTGTTKPASSTKPTVSSKPAASAKSTSVKPAASAKSTSAKPAASAKSTSAKPASTKPVAKPATSKPAQKSTSETGKKPQGAGKSVADAKRTTESASSSKAKPAKKEDARGKPSKKHESTSKPSTMKSGATVKPKTDKPASKASVGKSGAKVQSQKASSSVAEKVKKGKTPLAKPDRSAKKPTQEKKGDKKDSKLVKKDSKFTKNDKKDTKFSKTDKKPLSKDQKKRIEKAVPTKGKPLQKGGKAPVILSGKSKKVVDSKSKLSAKKPGKVSQKPQLTKAKSLLHGVKRSSQKKDVVKVKLTSVQLAEIAAKKKHQERLAKMLKIKREKEEVEKAKKAEVNLRYALISHMKSSKIAPELKIFNMKYKILGVKEFTHQNHKAIVVIIPGFQAQKIHAIKFQVISALEKTLQKQVYIVAKRKIIPKPAKGSTKSAVHRPNKSTLTSVHDSIMNDLIFPSDVLGKRTIYHQNGSKVTKVFLDRSLKEKFEPKMSMLHFLYKHFTGADVSFGFYLYDDPMRISTQRSNLKPVSKATPSRS